MNLKRTALFAVIVTGSAATLLAAFTAIPDVVTQLIIGFEALVASAVVVVILLRLPKMRSLSPRLQRQLIWFSACCTGAVVCLVPLALSVLRR